MEDDFALRYARTYPGVNSRAELVTLALGLRPERHFAPLARGLFRLFEKCLWGQNDFQHNIFVTPVSGVVTLTSGFTTSELVPCARYCLWSSEIGKACGYKLLLLLLLLLLFKNRNPSTHL